MKCSISSGHSCNVTMAAIMQKGRATWERRGGLGCPELSERDPPSAQNRAWPSEHHGSARVKGMIGMSLLGTDPGSTGKYKVGWHKSPRWYYFTEVCVLNSRFILGACLCLPALPFWSLLKWISLWSACTGCSFLHFWFFGTMWLWAVSQSGTEDNLRQNVVAMDSFFFLPSPKSMNLTV